MQLHTVQYPKSKSTVPLLLVSNNGNIDRRHSAHGHCKAWAALMVVFTHIFYFHLWYGEAVGTVEVLVIQLRNQTLPFTPIN